MARKRSKGVFIFGLLFIVLGALAFPHYLKPPQTPRLINTICVLYRTIMSIAVFICGIFILRVNPIARKSVIIICFLNIFGAISLYAFLINSPETKRFPFQHTKRYEVARQHILQQLKPENQQQALENLERSDESARKAAPGFFKAVALVFFLIPLLVLNFFIIYFFNRPLVKQQFEE